MVLHGNWWSEIKWIPNEEIDQENDVWIMKHNRINSLY